MSVYVFDLDGTLLDSMEVWEHLGEVYLRSLGKTPERNLSEKDVLYLQDAGYDRAGTGRHDEALLS